MRKFRLVSKIPTEDGWTKLEFASEHYKVIVNLLDRDENPLLHMEIETLDKTAYYPQLKADVDSEQFAYMAMVENIAGQVMKAEQAHQLATCMKEAAEAAQAVNEEIIWPIHRHFTKETSDHCPRCGALLNDTDEPEIMDEDVRTHWECPCCKAVGTRWSKIQFHHHEELTDKNHQELSISEEESKLGEYCPLCDAELTYAGDQTVEEKEGKLITRVHWQCCRCGAFGAEISDVIFDEHWVEKEDGIQEPYRGAEEASWL